MTDGDAYFNDGAAYERMMGRWSRRVGEIFLDWLEPAKGLRWLDVGCGNGAFTETLIARAAPAAVTGVDPSEGQLAYAREQFRAYLRAQLPTAAHGRIVYDAVANAVKGRVPARG